MTFEEWWDKQKPIKNNPALKDLCVVAYNAGRESQEKRIEGLRNVLEHYLPILRQYGCTKNGDHDDPSWCTELCCDYGKRARKALEADKEFM